MIKIKVLAWENTLPRHVKSYTGKNLNPAEVNVIDTTKDNFTRPLTIKEILDDLEIYED